MGQQNSPELSSLPAGKSRLRQAIELSYTIISLSYSIKVFTVKWQMIRNKLQDLLSGLTDIENHDSGEESALSGGHIQAIIDTLFVCNEFGIKCIELKFSGKLLMQSDLSILVSKIDDHIKCLSEIYIVGLLTNSNAIVVQKPGAMASRDDMKFFVNDILSRLKIGDALMKKQALIALNDVIQEDEKYVKICVETDGIVSILVNFLDSEVIEIRDEAAKGVCLISEVEVYRGVLAGAGIIAPLIRVLECGSEVGKECAARCLMKVTENSDNSWSVSAHGGVSVLLKIVKSDGCGGELVGLACGVLKNLAGVEEINKFMVEEGAILDFLGLLKSKDDIVLLSSMDYLQTMVSMDESNRDLIVREGGICVLIHVFDPKLLISSKAREMAFRGIKTLCLKSESSLNIVMNSGFINHVLYFLRYGEVSIQELALKASFWLCETSEEAQKAMGDAGFMAELVKFLDAKSFEVREMAALTLSIMVSVPRNRKRFVQNPQNVGLVVQLLDQDEANSDDRKVLLSIITSLVSSNSGRRSIVNSGYLRNIEKLAAAEVSDAKKIVRKLSSNKFTSIFSGIWHS
ncbi:Vacuolar protein 8 [Heracleum sosnowskyi]|uniref:Vacuolar protein 8 n=1 Tax=Heracleum sosnowskyi TaxID=360622 RepID=A0AAD8HJK3_9APIA|nr:Vacuolar protein 8 [Heracleum sosnowskyi]